jgi:surface polysaccharide O-acyltransferase-like enzyme
MMPDRKMDSKSGKQRVSNFELLRIIAMLCIIMGHSMTHGVIAFPDRSTFSPISYTVYRFLAYGGKIGVYLFVLLTGYFMINSEITVKKLVKLWLPIFFWSTVLTVIEGGLLHQLSAKDLLVSFVPILSNRYWFMSTYVFLYLLSPIINKAIVSTSWRQDILLALLAILVIVPCDYLYGKNINSWLVSFCFTYVIGAIIRKHKLLQNKSFIKLGCLVLVVGNLLNIVISSIIGFNLGGSSFSGGISAVLEKETLFDLLIAVGLFVLIGSRRGFYNQYINILASAAFGIYLIHDNPKMRILLWSKWLHFDRLGGKGLEVLLYISFVDLVVFAVCAILELIRKQWTGRLEDAISEKVDGMIGRGITK